MNEPKAFPSFEFSRTKKTMLAGGIAGSFAKTATAPLSRLTIIYQVHTVRTGAEFGNYALNESLLNVMKAVYKREGLRSFWRGNLTAVVHRFPYSAVNFSVYDFVKSRIKTGNIKYNAVCFCSDFCFID